MKSGPSISPLLVVATLVLGGAAEGRQSVISPCAGTQADLQAAEDALDRGQWEEADDLLDPLRSTHPSCARVLAGIARLSVARGDPAEAERQFSQALGLADDDTGILTSFARFQYSRGLLSQAAHLTARALALNPDDSDALVIKGQLSQRRGRFGEARAALERAVALDPANPAAHYELGVFFFRINLVERAAKEFEAAAAIRPQWTMIHVNLGRSYEMLGEAARAESAYTEAQKRNAGPFPDPSFDFNIGRFLLKQGRLDESRTHLDRAVSLNPLLRGPLYSRAKLNLAREDYQAARQDAERALALGKPGDVIHDRQVYYLLCTISTRLGEDDLVAKYAELARTAEAPNPGGERRR